MSDVENLRDMVMEHAEEQERKRLPLKAVEIKSKFTPHTTQLEVIKNPKRFKIILAGRRWGKTLLCVDECIETALTVPGRRIYFLAPLYRQAKEIAWDMLLDYMPREVIRKTNETELDVECVNGSAISLKGCDNPQSLVGVSLDLAILDECAQYKPEVWYRIIRPMLLDRKGRAVFISTPCGFNWFYELWKAAEKDPEFARFHFRTIDNTAIPGIPEEVEKLRSEAQSEYHRLLFRQECEAEFEAITGRPRFDLGVLRQLMEKSRDPVSNMGKLLLFDEIKPGRDYVFGVDTAEGLVTGDNSAVVVVDTTAFSVAAEYAGHMPPDILAGEVGVWAKAFNNALVVVEDNNHGLVTLDNLKGRYHNLYYRHVKDEESDRWTKKLGWRTTSRTKPILVGAIDKALRNGLSIPSKDVIEELMTFVVEDNGMTNAQEGCQDDRVMGLGCAVQGYMDKAPVNKEEKPEERPPRWSYAEIEWEEKQKMIEQEIVPSYWDNS